MTNITLSWPATLSLRSGLRASAVRLNPRAYALLAPSLIFLATFTYWPVAQVFWQSLHQFDRGHSTFVGLGNFAALVQDVSFRHALTNNLLYALGTIVPSLILALWFAVALQQSTWFNALLRSLIFVPVLVPLVAVASLFLFIFLPASACSTITSRRSASRASIGSAIRTSRLHRSSVSRSGKTPATICCFFSPGCSRSPAKPTKSH